MNVACYRNQFADSLVGAFIEDSARISQLPHLVGDMLREMLKLTAGKHHQSSSSLSSLDDRRGLYSSSDEASASSAPALEFIDFDARRNVGV